MKKQEVNSQEKIVRFCFGRYGEREEKNCKEDCRNCPEANSLKDVLFCKKKKTYPCLMMCSDTKKCQECYWSWWFKNKVGYCNQIEEIKKYMESHELKFEKRLENKDGKRIQTL